MERCDFAKLGYLPRLVQESSRKLDWNEPVMVSVKAEGCALDGGAKPRAAVGHLEGWGRGRHSGASAVYYQTSRGNGHRASLSWLVRGDGTLTVRAGSPRCGWLERELRLRR